MQSNNIEDADFEEVADDKSSDKLNKRQIIKALKSAVDLKQLSLSDAKTMQHEMGIFKSFFTKKTIDKKTRKTKRKQQKLARKKQRK